MDKVRAKFTVQSIERMNQNVRKADDSAWESKETQTVKFNIVTGGSKEDNTFAAFTPYGECKLTITNPDVVGFFELGKAYYLDFTPAPR